MIAKTIKANSTATIELALEQAMSDGMKPTLAVVFMSVKQDLDAVSKLLDDRNIQIFGATTAGEFLDGEIESGSVVIMLLDMDPASFKIEFMETSPEQAFADASKLGATGRGIFANPAFIIATGGIFIDGDQIIAGFMQGFGGANAAADEQVKIFGGMAGDDLIAEKPLVFTNGKCTDNAIITLAIDEDKIDVRGIASCGWEAVGTAKTVTRSEGNIVYTIDDKPALDTMMKYLGVQVKLDETKDIVSFLNAWYYPLQLDRDNGDSVIRATRFANRLDRSLICTGSVPQGAKIKFSLPPEFDAIDAVAAECASIKDEAVQEADALLMFSCVSRHLSFGDAMGEEITKVQDIWQAPMVGFFTYGEYGRSKIGNNEFHNNCCCIVALKEKTG